ncbi:MAG: ATP-binding protein [Myxococcales bacterium]|nr:ATP-binding protein [Myxococcales bacterium]
MLADASPHLKVALRRLRLQAAVARADQSGVLKPEEMGQLVAQLANARRDELAARSAGDGELPIDALARRLELRPLDESVLLAAVALEADPLFAITVSALGGEEPRQGLTAKLLAQLFGFAGDETLDLGLGAMHPLVRSGLLESPHGSAGMVETLRPWRAATRAVSFLAGSDDLDPLLLRCGGVIDVPENADLDHMSHSLELLGRAISSDQDVIVLVEGPEGAGRRTVAAAAAGALGRAAVMIDAGRLSADPLRFSAELRALRRECWLRGALPVVARIDALRRDGREGRFPEIADALESPGAISGAAIITAVDGGELPDFRRRIFRLKVETPGAKTRQRLWSSALGTLSGLAAENGAPSPLASVAERYTMTPGVIQRAAANARMLAQGRDLTVADVQAGVSTEIYERFGGLATRVKISQSWDDLVLPADTLDEIKAFSARAKHAALVYETWGFRDKLQRGLGLAALFSGPPGTGKTMVAGLIAGALDLELYVVDLANVVSKWVGETEKQLGRIFDAAAMGQALLLFDEADALFAKRTEVKSSNDRYANLEVNYLLQRIEAFGGVAILTTNLEASVDPAFKRRLAADVRFYAPERDERERLWRTLLPPRAPVAANLDFTALADFYKDMCGGHIRNAVLRGAFLAAAEGKSIAQDHLNRAARTEYRAMGKVL